MGKKSRKNRTTEQLPEGMSRRQAKLAARAAERERLAGNPRPFEGQEHEADLVALREFVPSAVVPVDVKGAERDVRVVTLLPGGAAALTRAADAGGAALVALQTRERSNDAGADLARALQWAAQAGDGETLETAVSGDAPALNDVLTAVRLDELEVFEGYDWWLPEGVERTPFLEQNLRAANDTVLPSYRVDADVPGAVWWVDPGERAHIRWIRPEVEGPLLDALARVHAADNLTLGEGSKFAGVFRADGVLVPVWDLDRERPYAEWAGPVEDFQKRLAEALESVPERPLTADERKSRDTIVSRQVTIR
ncbi:DUF5926 family protein [Corynebacterium sp. 335C]